MVNTIISIKPENAGKLVWWYNSGRKWVSAIPINMPSQIESIWCIILLWPIDFLRNRGIDPPIIDDTKAIRDVCVNKSVMCVHLVFNYYMFFNEKNQVLDFSAKCFLRAIRI